MVVFGYLDTTYQDPEQGWKECQMPLVSRTEAETVREVQNEVLRRVTVLWT